jgi:endonuclease/exonuclease/phosphatase family metal-dependent hydrolase
MNKFGVGVIASAVVLFGANAGADNIATIEGYSTGTVVTLDSSPVITAIASQGGGYTVNGHTYNSWSIVAQDSTGSIDLYGSLPGSYTPAVGDAVSAAGTYSPYHQIPEIASLSNLTQVSTGNVVPTPPVFTIPQLTASTTIPESQAGYVLQLTNVTIYTDSAASIPASGNFPNANTTYYLKDGCGNIMGTYFWVTSYSVDGAMIGAPIPTGTINVTGFMQSYTNVVDIIPLAFTAVPVSPPVPSPGTRTIRVVTYNIQADTVGFGNPGIVSPTCGLIVPYNGPGDTFTTNCTGSVTNGGVLEGIGEEIIAGDPAQPIDVLALQETTSNTITVQPIVNALNAFYAYYGNPAGYAMSPYQATECCGLGNGDGPNALVYNTNTLQLIASVPVDPPGGPSQLGSGPGQSGEKREVMRYEFAPSGVAAGTNNEFYVYVTHSISSTDTNSRNGEARIIRNDETSLPANARVLYVGDFNLYNSWEPAYLTILSNTAPNGVMQGGGVDPLNTSVATNIDWGDFTSNPATLFMLDECSYSLIERCELQMMTSNVYYDVAGGFQYVHGSHHSFGNNASLPYRSSVNNSTNTALNDLDPVLTNLTGLSAAVLLEDLTGASDHLPVVADYIIPIDAYACWRQFYFGYTTSPNGAPGTDADGTGMCNTDKFLAGFNPTNSAAYLHTISIATTNTTDILVTYLGANGDSTWSPGIASRTNILEYSTGAADGSYNGTFLPVPSAGATNILGGGNGLGVVTNMLDSGGATNVPSRYYRVRVLLP